MKRKKKYKLTRQTTTLPDGTILYRIKSIHRITEAGVIKGELGGWVQSERNLSQTGNCWIHNNAKVYGKAEVLNNAQIYDSAVVCDNAKICENAWVLEHGVVCNNAKLSGNAWVKGHAVAKDNSSMCDYACIDGKVTLSGNAHLCHGIYFNDNSIIHSDTPIIEVEYSCP